MTNAPHSENTAHLRYHIVRCGALVLVDNEETFLDFRVQAHEGDSPSSTAVTSSAMARSMREVIREARSAVSS